MTTHKPSVVSTQVTEWDNGDARHVNDYVAAEEPLEMGIGRRDPVYARKRP